MQMRRTSHKRGLFAECAECARLKNQRGFVPHVRCAGNDPIHLLRNGELHRLEGDLLLSELELRAWATGKRVAPLCSHGAALTVRTHCPFVAKCPVALARAPAHQDRQCASHGDSTALAVR